jgi:Ca2+/Na+ antiporter
LILGLAALLHPFRVHSDVLRRELPLMLIVSLLAGCVFYDGVLSYSDGIFCWRWPSFGCCIVLKSPVWLKAGSG